jgi:hypothetical protein
MHMTISLVANADDVGFAALHDYLPAGGDFSFYAQKFQENLSICTESIGSTSVLDYGISTRRSAGVAGIDLKRIPVLRRLAPAQSLSGG